MDHWRAYLKIWDLDQGEFNSDGSQWVCDWRPRWLWESFNL